MNIDLQIPTQKRAEARYLLWEGHTREDVATRVGIPVETVDKIVALNHIRDAETVLIDRLKAKVHMVLDNLDEGKLTGSTALQLAQTLKILNEVVHLKEGKATANVALAGLISIVESVDKDVRADSVPA